MLPTAVILVLIDNNYSINLSREHSGVIGNMQTSVHRDDEHENENESPSL